MIETLQRFLESSGFGQATLGNLVMLAVGLTFIYLAIRKRFEPLLLVPMGFGILVGNIPYNAAELSLSPYDGPVHEQDLEYWELRRVAGVQGLARAWVKVDTPGPGSVAAYPAERYPAVTKPEEAGVHDAGNGRKVFVEDPNDPGPHPVVVPPERQNPKNASVLWFLSRGVAWAFFPPLIFLGIGAMIDFGPLLANPKTLLLGAAAQFGIFGSLVVAVLLGFDLKEAAGIGIIGGADGPTAIFTASKLSPDLLSAIALSAYSYMAMVPLIQPPIMRLLTTPAERKIRMVQRTEVSRTVRILFPIVGFLITSFLANAALPLLAMLFLGNLLRECLLTDRLANTAQNALVDTVTILLGVSVGARAQAATFLTAETIKIFLIGIAAFIFATAAGVLMAKLMNRLSKDPINPLIGAAGVSAVPMAARVVQTVGQQEDKQNFLLMHAMGPNVAGVIGSAIAAGVLLSHLS